MYEYTPWFYRTSFGWFRHDPSASIVGNGNFHNSLGALLRLPERANSATPTTANPRAYGSQMHHAFGVFLLCPDFSADRRTEQFAMLAVEA